MNRIKYFQSLPRKRNNGATTVLSSSGLSNLLLDGIRKLYFRRTAASKRRVYESLVVLFVCDQGCAAHRLIVAGRRRYNNNPVKIIRCR